MSLQLVGWWGVLAPLLFAPLVYALRRRRPGAWLAALVCLGSAYALLAGAPKETVYLLGRPLAFGLVWAHGMALLLVAAACLFLFAASVSQGWSFYPFGLVILTLLGTAMAAGPLSLSALLVEAAALLAVFIIQGGRPGSVRGATRFLVMMTLATPLFLLATWQAELYRATLETPALPVQVALLVAGGFGLWMGAAPLHGWLSAVAMDAKPGVAAFVFIAFPAAATIILLRLLADLPWLMDVPHANEVLILAGLFSAGAGGLFAAAQKGVGPLMGYATLFDVGNSLVALGMGTQAGLMLVLYTTLVRVIALSLIGLAGGFLQREGRGDSFEQARGLARRRPLAAVGLMVGGATLAGAPLTAGFISRWLLLQALVEVDSRWPVIIALGGLGVATGFVRALRRLLAPAPPAPPPERAWLPNALIAGLSALCLGIGLFPQPVLDTVKTLARAMHIPVL